MIDASHVPGYWPNEQGGVLRPVIEKYLAGDDLDDHEVGIMRAYLHQWMLGDFRGPAIDALRRDVARIRTKRELDIWLDYALDLGIDPL